MVKRVFAQLIFSYEILLQFKKESYVIPLLVLLKKPILFQSRKLSSSRTAQRRQNYKLLFKIEDFFAQCNSEF